MVQKDQIMKPFKILKIDFFQIQKPKSNEKCKWYIGTHARRKSCKFEYILQNLYSISTRGILYPKS